MTFSFVLLRKKSVCACFLSTLVLFVAGFGLFSCQSEDKSLSYMSAIGVADNLIRSGKAGEAIEHLKRAERYAASPAAKIGVYRRYITIGENKLAEQVLVKGLKKISENLELSAVYGQFLLRTGRVSEAVKVTEVLSGTKYGSIHSEAVLKNNFSDVADIVAFNKSYLDSDFRTVYEDIFKSTEDNRWLMNAALIYLAKGDYITAANFQVPNMHFVDSEEAYFWALVQFDSENYELCLYDLQQVKAGKFRAECVSLTSDAMMNIGESEAAAHAREEFLKDALAKNVDIPPVLAVNSAISEYNNKNYSSAYNLLLSTMEKYPEYSPAMITYSKFAWEESSPPEMTDLEKMVRETDLRTARMKAMDERPHFLVSDALARMEKCIETQKKEGRATDDDLQMERLSLFLKSKASMPLKARVSEIWKELEKNEEGVNLYPSRLVQFAVQKFLFYGMVDDARTLFMNFVSAKYLNSEEQGKIKSKKKADSEVYYDVFGGARKVSVKNIPESVMRSAFGEQIAKSVDSLEIWEVEMAAYFALLDNNHVVARKLYEYVVFKTGGVVNDLKRGVFGVISPMAATSSSANLAMIYSGLGEKKNALDLYGLASGKEKNKRLKADLLYRIAKIQFGQGDTQQAVLSLDYCLALDSQNADARLLRRTIDASTNNKLENDSFGVKKGTATTENKPVL